MLNFFVRLSEVLNSIFFYEVYGFPILVVWLFVAGVYLSFKLNFPNIRLFKHGIDVAVKNKYYSPNDPGEMTPRQSLFTSITGTVGLGNISGVAIAVGLGGPGAVIWIIICGFFAMNTIFTEAVLAQTYREVLPDGKVNGGPFRYLKYGLKEIGFAKFGAILSLCFSVFFIIGSIGSLMVQVNQAIVTLTDFKIFSNFGLIISILFCLGIFAIIASGTETVGNATSELVPAMALIYTVGIFTILAFHFKNIPSAIVEMVKDAFTIKSTFAGFIGSVVAVGIKRASYSNEGGLGTSAIAHAVAKTKEPVRQASIASLTPMISAGFFCFLTGLAIVATGVHGGDTEGIVMTKRAFATVSSWFQIILSIMIVIFAFANCLATLFYAQSVWKDLSKEKYIMFFNVVSVLFLLPAGFLDLKTVVDISDVFFLSISIPNLIGVYMLSGIVKNKLEIYIQKLKSGEFEKKEKISK